MDKEMMAFYKNALQGAIAQPLCNEYRNEWRACGDDKEKSMKLALKQQSLPYVITAFNNGLGLSKEYLKEEYKDFINGKVFYDCDEVQGYTYTMNVDLQRDWTITTDVSAFLWCTNTMVTIPSTKCPTIYVGCNSDVDLALDGYNSIRVYLFDNSKITIQDSDQESTITIYKYGKEAQVEVGKYCLGEVKVFDKELRL